MRADHWSTVWRRCVATAVVLIVSALAVGRTDSTATPQVKLTAPDTRFLGDVLAMGGDLIVTNFHYEQRSGVFVADGAGGFTSAELELPTPPSVALDVNYYRASPVATDGSTIVLGAPDADGNDPGPGESRIDLA